MVYSALLGQGTMTDQKCNFPRAYYQRMLFPFPININLPQDISGARGRGRITYLPHLRAGYRHRVGAARTLAGRRVQDQRAAYVAAC